MSWASQIWISFLPGTVFQNGLRSKATNNARHIITRPLILGFEVSTPRSRTCKRSGFFWPLAGYQPRPVGG
jgi:hypothetical protein